MKKKQQKIKTNQTEVSDILKIKNTAVVKKKMG